MATPEQHRPASLPDDSTDELVLDDASAEEDEEASLNLRYEVSSYGVDYDVDGLIRRLQEGDIRIPHFQREFIWSLPQSSKFVESLLLGLPVPGVFLYRDPEDHRLSVVDGLQRLQTVRAFRENDFRGRPFTLVGVNQEFAGKRFQELEAADRRRFNDAVMHATVIRQDAPEESDQTSVYLIFERLNTGGTPLSPQEIRGCVYHGPFNELLSGLAGHEEWQALIRTPGKRGRDQELLLRFFALYYDLDKYSRPMKLFLTTFMESNRRMQRFEADDLRTLMTATVGTAVSKLGADAFRPARNLNTALADAILVGTARRLERGAISDDDAYRTAYQDLMDSGEFTSLYLSATTDVANVRGRIEAAADKFEGVP